MQKSNFYEQTFSVSQLNRSVKSLLETHFPLIWVEGEISNLSRPGSGHWYFTLKDQQAQISCAMFKRRNSLIKFKPEVGDHVKIRARVSLYEGRGDYQLITEHMEQAGFGILQKRFNELKDKLQSEGLFDQKGENDIPSFVSHLGVITSPTGAAIRDVLSVLNRRFPAMRVTVIPTPVQGDDAAGQISQAIQLADKQHYDALLVCRGGGSIEDLWAFNNEHLARTIAASTTPIICGIGHEVDFTIADFAANLRAPTPSAAAEMLSVSQEELISRLSHAEHRLGLAMQKHLSQNRATLLHLQKRLRHPREKVEQWYQALDQLETRMKRAMVQKCNNAKLRLSALSNQYQRASPLHKIERHQEQLTRLEQQLISAAHNHITAIKNRYQTAVAKLDIVSPMATISRGYSISSTLEKSIVRSVTDVSVGDDIHTLVSDGSFIATIKEVKNQKA